MSKQTRPDHINKYAKLYVDEIIRLHGAPISIVSDKDPRFTSHVNKFFYIYIKSHVNNFKYLH